MANNNKKLSETLLIDEYNLKLWSPISKNVSVDKVFPYVSLAQEFYLSDVLGLPLKEELQQQVEEDNLTPENKALMIKIFPVLGFWTSYLALRSIAYTSSQKSLVKEHSENSEALNDKEVSEYLLQLENNAQQFTEILIRYLCHCKDLYPLWRPSKPCLCDKYEIGEGKNEKDYKSLIYFPNKVRKSCCGCKDK